MYDEAFFASIADDSERSAAIVVPKFLELIQPQSVLDVGCGAGYFLHPCLDAGIEDVLGIDLHLPVDTAVDAKYLSTADLTIPLDLGRRFDMAICVEVAEHLHAEHADQLIETLCAHAPVVLFSAAIPEQGGEGHYNEQWPEYWQAKFESRHYLFSGQPRIDLWNDRRISYWYRQNLFLAVDPAAVPHRVWRYCVTDSPLSTDRLVHPDCWGSKLGVKFE
jgi:SAM-dependent methyltransferase